MSNKDGGWMLPEIINPPQKCICIPVPNERAHRQAFFGALTQLGYWFNWQRDAAHTALPVSVLWMNIVLEAQRRFYSDENEDCMCFDCQDLKDCLQPLFDDLRAQVNQDAIFRQYGTEYPTGVPLPPEAVNAPLAPGSNPGCNYDILWSQCEQLVDYSNIMITDTLEQVETATNNIELAAVFTQLPVLDELGADAIAGYIELLLDGIAENYAAEFDLAYRNGLACEIFCLCRVDCEITIERVYDVLLARVVSHFGSPGEAINTIGNLLSYLLDQDIDGDVIVDSLLFLLWGGAKLINSFIQNVGTKALQTILELAVNDANNDWVILCTDCPPLEEPIPELNLTPCDGSNPGGDFITSLGGTRWRVTSTAAGGDARVMIKAIDDLNFRLDNVTFPGVANTLAVWDRTGVVGCEIGATVPELELLTQAGWTWQLAQAGATVEFDMLP